MNSRINIITITILAIAASCAGVSKEQDEKVYEQIIPVTVATVIEKPLVINGKIIKLKTKVEKQSHWGKGPLYSHLIK